MTQERFIDVLSDSTGETAERVVRAALLQFPQPGVIVRRHARVRTAERAEPILRNVAADGALLVFSVVSPELSRYLHRMTAELGIEAIDVIGGVIGKLESFLDRPPVQRPGSLLPLSAEYFRRIEAVEFTVRSEAGREPKSLLRADLILVGLAQTAKTPIATLLAQRGLKVASVTVRPDSPLPAELHDVPPGRVVALSIDADSLCAIRAEQLRKLGMTDASQSQLRAHVEQEVRYAAELFAREPTWPVVEMAARTVEETAAIILDIVFGRVPHSPLS